MEINKVYFKNSKNMSEVGDETIDLIITSPPYFNIKDYSKNGTQKIKHSSRKKEDIGSIKNYYNYIDELLKIWKECYRILKPNGKLCINVPLMPMNKKEYSTHENRHIFDLQSDIQNSILSNLDLFLYDLYIWNRTNSTKKIMFGSYPYPRNFYNQNIIEFISIYVKPGKQKEKISKEKKEKSKLTKNEWLNFTKQIWDIPIPNKSDLAFGEHSAIMPEEIPYRLIKMFSFEGDIVLDPFSGSGTTLKIAKKLNRNYIGYEIYSNYKNLIDKKLSENDKKNDNKKLINKILCKDVLKALDEIEEESIDLIIADPPYNMSIADWDTFKNEEEFMNFSKKWIEKAILKLKHGGSFYFFNNAKNAAKLFQFIEDCGMVYQNWIVWYKKDGFNSSKKKFNNNQETILFFTKGNKYTFNSDKVRIPYDSKDRIEAAKKTGIVKNGKKWFPNKNGKLCPDVWEIVSERHSKKVNGKIVKQAHPTIKPIKLIERIIFASSNENDLILDLFSGTGTTSFVSKKNNRKFIAIENNKKYVEIIKERLKEC